MRLAFQHYGGDTWIAGNTFLKHIFLALRTLGPDRPTLVLVVGEKTGEHDYASLTADVDEVLRTQVLLPDEGWRLQMSLRYHLTWWLRRLLKTPRRAEPSPLDAVLPGQQLDGYFTMTWTETPVTTVPSVVWIPDFQHRRLPENYAPAEAATRDRTYSRQAQAAARILVTSGDVRSDLEAFAPAQGGKARLIPFVASVPVEVYCQDPRDGLARYNLPEKFVYLPNQFWQHKNHKLAFEALARLAARGIRPTLVSTGNPLDYRQLTYFTELMQMLSFLNIREQFILLGQVPQLDVYRLMRQAVAVLNSSKFEGLGLSVAESKSLGKRVLVSDLGALREQDAPGAVYFCPNDADDLAAKLEHLWTTTPPGPDHALEAAARAALPQRQAAFARELLQVFSEAQLEFQGRNHA